MLSVLTDVLDRDTVRALALLQSHCSDDERPVQQSTGEEIEFADADRLVS
jgi:hypothetical protein